ncbi:hypothetical protein QEN19_000133 [Hanseniaspora menglaensis]
MSLSGGKTSIFDQVNRFFNNGNNVPVKETPELKKNSEESQHKANFHSVFSTELDSQRLPGYANLEHLKNEPSIQSEKFDFFIDRSQLDSQRESQLIYNKELHQATQISGAKEQPDIAHAEQNDRLFKYFLSSNTNSAEGASHINEYLDSFDSGVHSMISPPGFSVDEINIKMLTQQMPYTNLNQSLMRHDDNISYKDNLGNVNELTPINFNVTLSGGRNGGLKQGRNRSIEIAKQSPVISPTVDAVQTPQYTPYLQARKNRFSLSSSSSNKVMKSSPTMKPSQLDKKSSYKVILPSSTSPMMLPRSVVNHFSKNNDDLISPNTDLNSQTAGENSLCSVDSNSSINKLKDENKILRATQSPVIRPVKKKTSTTNLKPSHNIPVEFHLDGRSASNSTNALKKTLSNSRYNKTLSESYYNTNEIDKVKDTAEKTLLSKHIFENNAPSNTDAVQSSVSGVPRVKTKKKEVHKEAEKNRRERLNVALEDLNDIIPDEIKSSDKFPSKATTVEHAADYIRYLVSELVKRDIPIELTVPSQTFVKRERKDSES